MLVRERRPEFEARQVTEGDADAVAKWCGGLIVNEAPGHCPSIALGGSLAQPSWWIVKPPVGSFMVLSESDFAATFEAA